MKNMIDTVERLGAVDFDEAMDFLNMVFSLAYGPTDFTQILPKLYQPTDKHMRCNLAIKREGKIKAIVGVFPMELNVNGKIIKIGGIGGVATHPRERNSGMMKVLMNTCLTSMQEEGIHLSCLSGIRQRYQFYGYEKAGSSVRMDFKKHNIKHGVKKEQIANLRFEKLDIKKEEWIWSAAQLYNKQPVYIKRDEADFHLFLENCESKPYVAIDNDEVVGYIVLNKGNNQINEIVANSNYNFINIIANWIMSSSQDAITIIMPLWEAEKIRLLGEFCEDSRLTGCGSWQVLKWAETIDAFLSLKYSQEELLNGEVVIKIANHSNLKVRVDNGTISCEEVNLEPDIVLDEFTATRLVFGYLAPSKITKLPKNLVSIFNSWFPLPLFIPMQDKV